MNLEVGQARIQATVEELALKADLVVLAFIWFQRFVVAVSVIVLGQVDFGEAGVGREVVVEVIGDAGIRHYLAGVLDLAGAADFVVVDPSAEDQVQVIREAEAPGDVAGALAGQLVVLLVRGPRSGLGRRRPS